ncbi:MAG: precorrin-6A/cobalt-precorrin-6A reductase, partial [Selenomonadaceae bacterium]|nr:precorrin-6A/cobalt-precorrin-6A reductase [Selenomonadaceae bacterium]
CEKLGFTPKQIIAMQGPFSQTLNEAMFKQYDAQVIVTKNSGTIGGADTKFAAAEALGLPIVLIDRPKVTYGQVARSFEDVLAFIRQHEEA